MSPPVHRATPAVLSRWHPRPVQPVPRMHRGDPRDRFWRYPPPLAPTPAVRRDGPAVTLGSPSATRRSGARDRERETRRDEDERPGHGGKLAATAARRASMGGRSPRAALALSIQLDHPRANAEQPAFTSRSADGALDAPRFQTNPAIS